MKIKKKVLITGGAGYIGQSLVQVLFSKTDFDIVVVDNLTYGKTNLTLFEDNKDRITFYNLDALDYVRNFSEDKIFAVVILHGLVGDPITNKYRELSLQVNEIDMKIFIELISSKVERIIFASTCSNYGVIDSGFLANEESPLNPLSLYAESKVKIENFIFDNINNLKLKSTILRFSTAFGVSSRMRFDLTLNEFAKYGYFNEKFEAYDTNTWRPYLHIKDISQAILGVLKSNFESSAGEIFNVGDDSNNATKEHILHIVQKFNKDLQVTYQSKGRDLRDYRVSFEKIRTKLNFYKEYDLEYGVNEIYKYLDINCNSEIDSMGNYEIE